jgi:hypothetical protein
VQKNLRLLKQIRADRRVSEETEWKKAHRRPQPLPDLPDPPPSRNEPPKPPAPLAASPSDDNEYLYLPGYVKTQTKSAPSQEKPIKKAPDKPSSTDPHLDAFMARLAEVPKNPWR